MGRKRKKFDATYLDSKWNEAELSDFWMSEILKEAGWSTSTSDNAYFRKEVKSSNRDRVDIVLYINSRIVGCIELKCPNKVDLNSLTQQRVHLSQASKYALSKYKYYHGAIVSPIGVLCNGRDAFVFDGSMRFDAILNFHKHFKLSKKEELTKFTELFSLSNFDLEKGYCKSPLIKSAYVETQKPPTTTADAQLSKDLYALYKRIYDHEKVQNVEIAFSSAVTLFILAVLRDCGLFPNDEIKRLHKIKSKKSWSDMVNGVSKILHSDLKMLKTKYCEAAWDFYEDTSWFCVNLATFPAAGLGRAYEDLLKAVSKNSTSFYTPSEIIDSILDELKPSIKDRILDPTCGSAAFLATVVDRITESENLDANEARKYIQNNIVGVDKDWFAVQIAKMCVVAVYAKNITYTDEAANKFKAPKVDIRWKNFFDFESNKPFDLIIGNPPWGSIDVELESKYYGQIKKYESYEDKSDICTYVVEKCWGHLSKKGKFGLVCKRDILDGVKHEKHRALWPNRVKEVWDYGRRHLFHNNPAQSMVLLGAKDTKDSFNIVPKDDSANRLDYDYRGIELSRLFDIYRGFESGDDAVYKLLAEKYPDHPNSVGEIADRNIDCFKILPGEKIFFLDTHEALPKHMRNFLRKSKLTKTLKKSKNRKIFGKNITNSALWFLSQRENCLRGDYYDGWSWVYRNGVNAGSILMPRYIRGNRCRAALILDNSPTLASLTVMSPKNVREENKYYILAFLNSRTALDIVSNSVKLADAGKVAAFPAYVNKIKVPLCRDKQLKKTLASIAWILSHTEVPSHIRNEALKSIDIGFDYILNEKPKSKTNVISIIKDLDKTLEKVA